MPGEKPITYSQSGVNYDDMDPFKIACQQAAINTASNIRRFDKYGIDVREITRTRGDSAFKISVDFKRPTRINIGHVEEGLGTKDIVAQSVREAWDTRMLRVTDDVSRVLGTSFFRGIAIDTASAPLNDLATSGASPINYMPHIAAAESSWFKDTIRTRDIIDGTVEACNQARCAWGGGESPTLRDIIVPGRELFSGSAIGIELPEIFKPMDENNLKEGQRMLFLLTPGVNINGLTLLRRDLLKRVAHGNTRNWLELIGQRFGYYRKSSLLDAYAQDIGNGKTYGESILTPTPIYSAAVDGIHEAVKPIEHAVNITGHGLRKIMRAQKDLTYVVDKLPQTPQIFNFIQDVSGMSNEQIYQDYNMGVGFVLFMEQQHIEDSIKIAKKLGFGAMNGGYIETGPRRVVIDPVGIEYKGETLQVR